MAVDLFTAAVPAAIGALAGVGGAAAKAWLDARAGKELGLPTNTEQRILDLREELIQELEKEVARRKESEDNCLRALAKEVLHREQLERKVDDQQIQITRLLHRLGQGVGE